MRNEVLLKEFGLGSVKLYGFYGNPLYASRGVGGGGRPTKSIISRVLLILEH